MRRYLILSLLGLLFAGSAFAQTPSKEANKYRNEGYRLVWSDEFSVDGRPDPRKWSYEKGFERNHEAQYYQRENVECRDGLLVFEGRREKRISFEYNPNGRSWDQKPLYAEYTSASINTRNKFSFLYGRMEVRAKIPTSKGAWPAIWLLGVRNSWPHNGEIDVMEYYHIKGEPHILANAAWGGKAQWQAIWDDEKIHYSHFTQKDAAWGEKFHIWRMDWDEEAIRIYLDGELLNEIPLSETINQGTRAKGFNPFTQEQYILLNLAMGGDNGGPIDDKALPMHYEVDYVRVYQRR